MLRGAGQLKSARPGRSPLAIGNWYEVFQALGATEDITALDCKYEGATEFLVGKVVGLTADAVGFHHFDATAEWDRDPVLVPFKDIARVQFGDRYTRAFAPYVGSPPAS